MKTIFKTKLFGGETYEIVTILTPRQAECLSTIRSFQRYKLYSPSMGEVADEMNISKNAAQRLINHLEEKGYLRKSDNGTILYPKDTYVELP